MIFILGKFRLQTNPVALSVYGSNVVNLVFKAYCVCSPLSDRSVSWVVIFLDSILKDFGVLVRIPAQLGVWLKSLFTIFMGPLSLISLVVSHSLGLTFLILQPEAEVLITLLCYRVRTRVKQVKHRPQVQNLREQQKKAIIKINNVVMYHLKIKINETIHNEQSTAILNKDRIGLCTS